ncbi:Exocyst complex component EXO70H1 [Linum perenne]
MQKAMGRLEKEFHLILRSNREQLDAELVSVRDSFVVASSRSYNRTLMLVDLEDGEVTDGDDIPTRETEISEVDGDLIIVISDLKSIADCMIGDAYTKECIHNLDSDLLELKIKKWLYVVKVAVKTLFNDES